LSDMEEWLTLLKPHVSILVKHGLGASHTLAGRIVSMLFSFLLLSYCFLFVHSCGYLGL